MKACVVGPKGGIKTYVQDRGVFGHRGRSILLDARGVFDTEVLDITAAENDVLVDLVRGCYFFFRPTFTTLRTE
jgi:hypothetical protein